MTSQNRLITVTTISPNFVNIRLQHKPREMDRASFTPAIDSQASSAVSCTNVTHNNCNQWYDVIA
eukprot:scaffold19448_cov53-Cyclotella_meneghiniana.AAC.1